jgi:hypothetical protein
VSFEWNLKLRILPVTESDFDLSRRSRVN